MISTIKKWIYSIRNYDSLKFQYDELARILSGGEWNEGDNRVEAIEAYQSAYYLKIHRQDVINIFMQNMGNPEEAAQELFDYFDILEENDTLKPKE